MIHLRVDDFPNTKDAEVKKHSLEAFKEFDEVIRSAKNSKGSSLFSTADGKIYTLGVIPDRCSDKDWEFLKESPHIDVAMHGIRHLESYMNEFPSHLTKREVSRALVVNRAVMECRIKRPIVTYIPPHNTIDIRTVSALLEAGFEYFMTGPETDPNIVVDNSSCEPRSIHSQFPWEYGRSDELLERGSIDHIRDKIKAGRPVILTLHWTWEYNIGLNHLSDYFSKLSESIG